MTATAERHPDDAHRHTTRCYWDLHQARWRCAERRTERPTERRRPPDPADLPRLPRALVEPRRRPAPSRRPGAPLARLGGVPGVDDAC
jgi:hypothetical protein